MRIRFPASVALAACLVAVPARALELGDEAPPLKVDKWIKGGPIELKKGEKDIYVVEFWATWCGPCRMSIPHLTEMQKKYKDQGVTIIGVSTDAAEGPNATRKEVAPFVETMGEKMGYAVVTDQADRATEKAYMEPFLMDGIPTAFIIRGGRIVWAGHPMDDMDKALDQILAGKYDLSAARKADAERRVAVEKERKLRKRLSEYFKLVCDSAQPEGAEKLGAELLADLGKDAMLLNDFAWQILTAEQIQFRDRKLALQAAKAALDASEGKSAAIVDTYARALFDTGKLQEAVEYQRRAVKLAGEDPQMREMKAELEEVLRKYEEAAKKGGAIKA